MKKMIGCTLMLVALAAPTVASASITFDASATPTPAADLEGFFANRTWSWASDCKGCGAYFAADHTYTNLWKDKGGWVIGHGTWAAKDGSICWTTSNVSKGKVDPAKEHCWQALTGSGTGDKKNKILAAMGIKNPEGKDFMWLTQGKQIWKDFIVGDKITPVASKIEPTLK